MSKTLFLFQNYFKVWSGHLELMEERENKVYKAHLDLKVTYFYLRSCFLLISQTDYLHCIGEAGPPGPPGKQGVPGNLGSYWYWCKNLFGTPKWSEKTSSKPWKSFFCFLKNLFVLLSKRQTSCAIKLFFKNLLRIT